MASTRETNWNTALPDSFWPPHLKASSVAVTVVILVLLQLVYKVFLYPILFTPLKHIPAVYLPFINNTKLDPSTLRGLVSQLRHSINTVPNNGLLRFYHPFRQERVIITGTKALNEILVSNATRFVKPQDVRDRLYTVAGNGLLLAEGEVHKVR